MKFIDNIFKLLGIKKQVTQGSATELGQVALKSDTLKKLYKRYSELNLGDSDYASLIETVQGDDILKRFSSESSLECIVDSGDFYKHLKGIKIVYKNGEFEILDQSLSGFPDFIKAQEYKLETKNMQRVFPENFTPEMLRKGILNYIVQLDQVYEGSVNPETYNREKNFDGFEWLYEQFKEKKE